MQISQLVLINGAYVPTATLEAHPRSVAHNQSLSNTSPLWNANRINSDLVVDDDVAELKHHGWMVGDGIRVSSLDCKWNCWRNNAHICPDPCVRAKNFLLCGSFLKRDKVNNLF